MASALASVDERQLPIREIDERRVALTDVDEGDAKRASRMLASDEDLVRRDPKERRRSENGNALMPGSAEQEEHAGCQDEQTLRDVAARWPAIDMTPYAEHAAPEDAPA